MSEKPAFDPAQPFDTSKPAFDASQPFEPVKSAPQWSDIPGNAMKAFEPDALLETGKNLLTPWPVKAFGAAKDAVTNYRASGNLADLAKGIPGEPIGEGIVNAAKGYGAGELIHGDIPGALQHAKTTAIEHPISTGLDIASIAAPFLAPGAESMNAVRADMAERAGTLANKEAVKVLEGSRGQILQLPEAARQKVGGYLRDKDIVSVTRPTSLGMERRINQLSDEAGAAIGEGRRLGDAVGGAPTAEDLTLGAHSEFSPSYESGRLSGRRGEFDRAMETLKNPVIEKGRPTGEQIGSFQGNAAKATEMYGQAIPEQKLTQSKESPYADIAGKISHENNAALEKALTPEQFSAYKVALGDYSTLEKIQRLFARGESGDYVGKRAGGPFTDAYHGLKDVFGHRAIAAGAGAVSDVLSSPAVAKALPSLSAAAKAGPAALETTHYMLQKNDPEYAEATGGASHSEDMTTSVKDGPDGILSQVLSNPTLAKWGKAFQDAATRGPQAIVANHFTLMQRDPDYNKAFMDQGKHHMPHYAGNSAH